MYKLTDIKHTEALNETTKTESKIERLEYESGDILYFSY